MLKRYLFVVFFSLSLHASAQYFLTGVEPFGTKWRQIKTSSFRIIFPSDAQNMANRYANLLSLTDTVTPQNLHAKQKSFDVVIHPHSILSNGFVAWAPKRMEVVTQFPASSYAEPWLTQLAIHETRHTSQMFRLNSGIIKPASFFLGEQAVGLAASFVPFWFLEGDAVAFETAATNSGRGRQADFYQYYRAHLLKNPKGYKYDKWLMGSFKDEIPNHYNFGYQLVSYAKVKYGDDVWANTLRYVSRNPYTIFPFYFGFKRQTGLSRKQLFEKTFANLDSIWLSNQKFLKINKVESLVKDSKMYTDYRYPFPLDDSIVIAYKSSLSKNSRFIKINLKTKQETTLFTPGYITSKPSYFKDNIFWTEFKQNVRWEYCSYSIIKWYNISKGRIKIISDKGRYFSPIYNQTNGLIYAISGNSDGSSSIVAFNFNSKIVQSIPLPQDYQPYELFIKDDKDEMFVGVITDKGKSIVKVNDDGRLSSVYGPTFLDIHSLSAHGNFIFFSTSSGYKEDLFSINIVSKAITQVTYSEFGSTDPFYNAKAQGVLYSNYSVSGYTISESRFDSTDHQVLLNEINDDWISKRLSASEKFNIDSVSIPGILYKDERYHGFKRFINVHSWAPFFFDPNQLTAGMIYIKPGVTVFAQNLIGTSLLSAGYGFDKTNMLRVNYQYFGLFPVLSYEFNLSNEKPVVYQRRNTIPPNLTEQKRESVFSLYLPLQLSSGRFSTIFYPFVTTVISNNYLFSTNDSLYHRGFQRFLYRAYFSVQQQKTHKDIRPSLGFVADINLENAPLSRKNFGSLLSGDFIIFLPGIGANHSLLIKQSIQKQSLKHFYFSNMISNPRGYQDFSSEKFKALSFEYLMPIVYPDFAFGSLAYLKRISINSFYEYAKNEYLSSGVRHNEVMKSFGFEIYTDVNFLRTRYPIRLNFQQGWQGNNLSPFNSFSISVDFYGQ